MPASDPNAQLNLSKASVLLVDGSQHSLDVSAQIFKGFGVAQVHRCDKIADAEKWMAHKAVDLLVIDPVIEERAGYKLVRDIRHSGGPNAFVPVILMCGHVRKSDVAQARNIGVNFVVTKPVSPAILLQRVLWVARDKRPFVEVGDYIGPDRRFKFEGPPPGSDGRRTGDLSAPLGEADEPNMSQDEIDSFIKPQRVMI